jgi:hypothetical protein
MFSPYVCVFYYSISSEVKNIIIAVGNVCGKAFVHESGDTE